MPLQAGRALNGGLIIGECNPGDMTADNGPDVFNDVLQALTTHHGIRMGIDPRTHKVEGPICLGTSSPVGLASTCGTVLRVLAGTGRLDLNALNERPLLQYGDWAFIPSSQIYTCTSVTVQGMNLRFATAELTRQRA